jgi:hypothetical protein
MRMLSADSARVVFIIIGDGGHKSLLSFKSWVQKSGPLASPEMKRQRRPFFSTSFLVAWASSCSFKINDYNICAILRKTDSHGPANSAIPTADQGNFALQLMRAYERLLVCGCGRFCSVQEDFVGCVLNWPGSS